MRTVTAGEQAVLEGAHYATHCRVLVEDSTSTWRDLSTLGGMDWNHSGEVTQNVDQIVATAEVQLWRQHGAGAGSSLSPLLSTSAYAGYIGVGRGVRIDFATVANDATPGAGDWKRVFEGTIDEWDAASSPMTISARDAIGAEIADRWIEAETRYGGDAVQVEDVMQAILDDWTDGITLYVPSAPGFVVTSYKQQKMSVMDALLQLAALIGWVVEPRWDNGTGAFRLTFYEPDRAPASIDWEWSANQYQAVEAFKLSRLNVRNSGSIWYTDAATGARVQYTVEDATSVAAYGRQFIEFEEAEDSPIDSSTEAQAMLDSAVLDLKDPVADGRWRTFCFWPVQLGDNHGFYANNVHFDAYQEFGVTGFTHSWTPNGHVATTLDTRGKPAGFIAPWLIRGGRRRNATDAADAASLTNWQFLYDEPTEGQITITWERGADVYEVWVYVKTLAQPVAAADQPWPADGDAPTSVLSIGTDSLVVDVPDAGNLTFVQFEARDASAEPLSVYRYELRPKAVSTFADFPGGAVTADALIKAAQTYGSTVVFTETGTDSITWSSGTLTFADGDSYSISGSGTTVGTRAAPTYVYFDATVSTTALQVTTNWSTAVGDNAVLVAVAWEGVLGASIVPGVGVLALDGEAINAFSIRADNIGSNQITAAKITSISLTTLQAVVGTLSALTADIGTVTAGTIGASIILATGKMTATSLTVGYYGGAPPSPPYYPANCVVATSTITLSKNDVTDGEHIGRLAIDYTDGTVTLRSFYGAVRFSQATASKPTIDSSGSDSAQIADIRAALSTLGLTRTI